MYNEETLSNYVETINCADGDCLILAFDMDMIDIDTGNIDELIVRLYEEYKI